MAVEDVSGLARRWRQAGGSMERVRVMADAARTLGGLSRQERRMLARGLAERGAPDLAERIERRSGGRLSGSELTDAARQLLSLDPQMLGDLGQSLRDPEERERLLSDVAARALPPPTGPPIEVAATEPSGAEPEHLEPEHLDPEHLDPQHLDPQHLDAEHGGTTDAETDEVEPVGTAPGSTGPVDVAPSDIDPVDLGTWAHDDGDAWEHHEDLRAPGDDLPRSVEPPPVAALAPTVTVARHVDVDGVVARLRQAATAHARIVSLATLDGATLDGDEMMGVLAAVPDGWERRRAAVRLVPGAAITEADVPRLLRLLDRDSDRFAVAAALVDATPGWIELVGSELPERAAARLERRTRLGSH